MKYIATICIFIVACLLIFAAGSDYMANKKRLQELSDIVQEGYDNADLPLYANPYFGHPEKAKAWIEGWRHRHQ